MLCKRDRPLNLKSPFPQAARCVAHLATPISSDSNHKHNTSFMRDHYLPADHVRCGPACQSVPVVAMHPACEARSSVKLN